MTQPAPSLSQLQRWMQAVLTHPDGVLAGVHTPAAQAAWSIAPHEIETIIQPSSQLSGTERLSVYATAYFARLLECLRDEFPAVCAAVGDDAFNGLALTYLVAAPPSSYTLGDLGRGFANHLERTRPPRDRTGSHVASAPEVADWADFLIDLAHLERTYAEVFDGPGTEGVAGLTPDQLAGLTPRQWANATLQMAPCLRLLKLRFPVHEYATAVRAGQTGIGFPEARTCHLVITRQDFIVRRACVDSVQFELLRALQAGTPIGPAIDECRADSADSDTQLATHLHEWFRTWSAAGYFVDIHGV